MPALPAEPKNQEAEPRRGPEFAEGERCARQKKRSLEDTGGYGFLGSLNPCSQKGRGRNWELIQRLECVLRGEGGCPLKQRGRGEGPQVMLPCLGAPSCPKDSGHPGQRDHSRGVAVARGRPPGSVGGEGAGVRARPLSPPRSAVRRGGGLRGPLPPGPQAQARLASARPAQRPSLLATLTGPSHGALRAPPARAGAAATAAAAIPGPGAAPHPAPPPAGRPEMT